MIVMRVTDILLTLPTTLTVLFLTAIFQTDEWVLIIALAVTTWPNTARIIRGEFLSLREQEYILSAKAIGCSGTRIIFRHMLPNTLAPLVVNATLLVAVMITVESALSF